MTGEKLYAVECMASAQHYHYVLTRSRAIRVFRDAESATEAARALERAQGGSVAYRAVELEFESE